MLQNFTADTDDGNAVIINHAKLIHSTPAQTIGCTVHLNLINIHSFLKRSVGINLTAVNQNMIHIFALVSHEFKCKTNRSMTKSLFID